MEEKTITKEEILAKIKAAKSPEELIAIADGNGVTISEQDAKAMFAALHSEGELSDEQLEDVAGGGTVGDWLKATFKKIGDGIADLFLGADCPKCGSRNSYQQSDKGVVKTVCGNCQYVIKTKKV